MDKCNNICEYLKDKDLNVSIKDDIFFKYKNLFNNINILS